MDYTQYEKENKNKIFNYPEKPLNAFRLFISENIKKIIENIKSKDYNKIRIEALNLWNALADEKKMIYKNTSKNNFKLFNYRKKEFESFGYYYSNKTLAVYKPIKRENNSKRKKQKKKSTIKDN